MVVALRRPVFFSALRESMMGSGGSGVWCVVCGIGAKACG